MIMVSLEAMANAWRSDGCAASSVLEMILKDSTPAIGKVPALGGPDGFRSVPQLFTSVLFWDLVLFPLVAV